MALTQQESEYLDEVVNGILELIGSPNKLKIVIGAKDFFKSYFGEDKHPSIQFKFPRTNRLNCCQITLDVGKDLYSIEFFDIRKLGIASHHVHSDIFCEDLVRIFQEKTGLYLSL
jgi:hypothetical protein